MGNRGHQIIRKKSSGSAVFGLHKIPHILDIALLACREQHEAAWGERQEATPVWYLECSCWTERCVFCFPAIFQASQIQYRYTVRFRRRGCLHVLGMRRREDVVCLLWNIHQMDLAPCRHILQLLLVPIIVPGLHSLVTHPSSSSYKLLRHTSCDLVEKALTISNIRCAGHCWLGWRTPSLQPEDLSMHQRARNGSLN
jgi:hypothetical protein